jgi:carbon-monoxide dehydrogenase small subunit
MSSTTPPPVERPAKRLLKLRVNGSDYEVAAWPSALLLDVLRYDLNLVGTKRGCDMGTCGCCNVLIDGVAEMSCMKLAFDCEGHEVTTIEGLTGEGDAMHPLQEAWAETGGSQCGFCTPGFIVTSEALLRKYEAPSEDVIREAISGNVCRCTGYMKIIDAIQLAARRMRGEPARVASGGSDVTEGGAQS